MLPLNLDRTGTAFCGSCVVLICALCAGYAHATSLQLEFTAPTSFNDSNNRQAILKWDAEPGRNYFIQSTEETTPASEWKNVDVAVKSSVGPVRWMAPEALRERKYYRVLLPATGSPLP